MRKLLSITLSIFVIAQSCSLNNSDKEVVVRVDDEFSINMYEILGNSRQLVFELQSIENQPCLNTTINRTVLKKLDEISLYINGINQVSDCTPGQAPATGIANVGAIQNKTFDFLISVRNALDNEGKLTVNDEFVTISLPTTDGIKLIHSRLDRIPDQFIWGYAAYDAPNLVGNAPNNFINSVAGQGQPKILDEGYYGHFSVDINQNLTLKENPNFNHVETFFFKYTGEKETLSNILEVYRNSPEGAQMELKIFTSQGWVL